MIIMHRAAVVAAVVVVKFVKVYVSVLATGQVKSLIIIIIVFRPRHHLSILYWVAYNVCYLSS